jgi:hypothetical protein
VDGVGGEGGMHVESDGEKTVVDPFNWTLFWSFLGSGLDGLNLRTPPSVLKFSWRQIPQS